jgi:transposase
MLASGESYLAIRSALKRNANHISRWKARFEEDRLLGLSSRHGDGAALY